MKKIFVVIIVSILLIPIVIYFLEGTHPFLKKIRIEVKKGITQTLAFNIRDVRINVLDKEKRPYTSKTSYFVYNKLTNKKQLLLEKNNLDNNEERMLIIHIVYDKESPRLVSKRDPHEFYLFFEEGCDIDLISINKLEYKNKSGKDIQKVYQRIFYSQHALLLKEGLLDKSAEKL